MPFVRAHLLPGLVVVAAVAATAAVLTVARPQYHPSRMPSPPGDGLTYTAVVYTRADASRAFAARGIRLLPGARTPGIADLHSPDGTIEVSVFGDRKTVDASGFSDYYTFADGRWERAPRQCGDGARNAERWHANVRLIVDCRAAAQLPRAARALASLTR
jgi:hypothetical protein